MKQAGDRGPRPAQAIVLPALLFLALALVPPLSQALGLGFYLSLMTRIMILGLAALALDLVLGIGGMVSLGHAAFIGIGAYSVGILAEHGIASAFVQWPVGVAFAALAAFLIGALSVRATGVYFIMVTLAFAQMLYFAATSLSRYGGDDGLTIWGRSELAGFLDLADGVSFYYLTLAILLLSYLALRRIAQARFGRALSGIRQNERRMKALGYDTVRLKLVAFTLSGALAGLAGILLANHTEFVAPAYMTWIRSGELILMLVIGGLGTLHGAILGAAVFLLLEEILAEWTPHWQIVMGPLVIFVVLFAKSGLVRLRLPGRPA